MGRHYTEEFKTSALASLAANRNNMRLTARQLGIPPNTLKRWSADMTERAQNGAQKSRSLSDKLEDIAHKLIDALDSKIGEAGLAATATAAGIAIDKMRLLREQATLIVAGEMTDEQRQRRLDELATRIRQRRLGVADSGGTDGVGSVVSAADLGAESGTTGSSVPE